MGQLLFSWIYLLSHYEHTIHTLLICMTRMYNNDTVLLTVVRRFLKLVVLGYPAWYHSVYVTLRISQDLTSLILA